MMWAKHSYLQFCSSYGLPLLPTYNDFQIKVKHKFNVKNEIYFVGLGAIDQFALNFDANKTESPAIFARKSSSHSAVENTPMV